MLISIDTSITGTWVKHVMHRLAEARGLPQSITIDNGPALVSELAVEGFDVRQ